MNGDESTYDGGLGDSGSGAPTTSAIKVWTSFFFAEGRDSEVDGIGRGQLREQVLSFSADLADARLRPRSLLFLYWMRHFRLILRLSIQSCGNRRRRRVLDPWVDVVHLEGFRSSKAVRAIVALSLFPDSEEDPHLNASEEMEQLSGAVQVGFSHGCVESRASGWRRVGLYSVVAKR
eukprot:scaffold3038_cov250-Pinguiococcus_pyrenoidosus.AAC.4